MRRLEAEIRSNERPDNLVLLLRGGVDSADKLARQSHALARRFTYKEDPAYGISLFAATAGTEGDVLRMKFKTYPRYRRVDPTKVLGLATLLPTFQAPHWNALFESASEDSLLGFLDVLGPVLDNPMYRPRRRSR